MKISRFEWFSSFSFLFSLLVFDLWIRKYALLLLLLFLTFFLQVGRLFKVISTEKTLNTFLHFIITNRTLFDVIVSDSLGEIITKHWFFHWVLPVFQKVTTFVEQIHRREQIFIAFPIAFYLSMRFWHNFRIIRVHTAKIRLNQMKYVEWVVIIFILMLLLIFILFSFVRYVHIFEVIDIMYWVDLTIVIFSTCFFWLCEMLVENTLISIFHIVPLLKIYLGYTYCYFFYLFLLLLVLSVSIQSLFCFLLKRPFSFILFLSVYRVLHFCSVLKIIEEIILLWQKMASSFS